MSISISVKVDTTELERIARNLDTRKQEVGRKVGPMIETDAKTLSPLDTGALRSSINTTYPGGDVIARIQTDIEYAKYQELGFHHWITGAFIQNAFLIPAIEMNTGMFLSPTTWQILFT